MKGLFFRVNDEMAVSRAFITSPDLTLEFREACTSTFSPEHQLSFKGPSKICEGLNLSLPAGQRYWHINLFSNYANKL